MLNYKTQKIRNSVQINIDPDYWTWKMPLFLKFPTNELQSMISIEPEWTYNGLELTIFTPILPRSFWKIEFLEQMINQKCIKNVIRPNWKSAHDAMNENPALKSNWKNLIVSRLIWNWKACSNAILQRWSSFKGP